MGRSGESFGKKEKEKKRAKQKQDKHEKMEERKANATKKSLDDMMAYLDENGNLSTTPPDPKKMKTFNLEDMEIGVPKQRELSPEELIRKGVVNFFNKAKGFGFIRDLQTQESVFFHQNQLTEELNEGDKLTYETEMGAKGPVAINIKKV